MVTAVCNGDPSGGAGVMGTLSDGCHDNESEAKGDSGYTCHKLQPTSPLSPSISPSLAPDIYKVIKDACALQSVRWPVECQVLPDAINHIEDWPLCPEPFYEATTAELRPQPVGEELGRLVYQYYPTSAVNYFSRSCVGGNKFLNDDVRPPLLAEDDTTLQFESRFESGNLAKAFQISECYYELHLRSDLYTSRHTQWYYFGISNTRKNLTYRLSIVNLCKGDSLYNHGLRPLMYSTKEAEDHSIGWRRCASNIVYFRNQDSSESGGGDTDDEGEEEAPSYTLTFNVTFPHDSDTVYIAHCYPYTFTDLQHHLLSIQNQPERASVCRQRVLCRSLAGNPVNILTITGFDQEDDYRRKRAVVLTSRVHPGETPSSWIMKGIIDYLTSQHPIAVELRRQFVFKVVPMLNPDGVIVGNHRCSLVGRDLNRQYKMVVKEMFPSVWHTKAMVRKLMDDHGVVMYCDFHAHSRKNNIFVYGCENRRSHENHLREQIFPLLISYNASDKFSFKNCKFKVQRCKEGTARVVVWMMGVLHSYTLESSFCGPTEGPRASTHFSILDYFNMGRQFCEALHEYFDIRPGKEKIRNKLWSRLIKKGSCADEPTAIDLSNSDSSSVDSDRHHLSIRNRKKKFLKTVKRRVTNRPALAQEVEKLANHIKPDKTEKKFRHINNIVHTSASATGSPVTGRKGVTAPVSSSVGRKKKCPTLVRASSLSGTENSHYSSGEIEGSSSACESIAAGSAGTLIRPTQYQLSHTIPSAHSAPPLVRASHGLIKPPSAFGGGSCETQQPNSPGIVDVCEPARDINSPGPAMDGTKNTYMEHMEQMMASRLALSDHEDESLSTYWESAKHSKRKSYIFSKRPQWDWTASSTGSPKGSGKSQTIKSDVSRRNSVEKIEPVIAKQPIHDSRSQSRNASRSPPVLYKSVRMAQLVHKGTSSSKKVVYVNGEKLFEIKAKQRITKEQRKKHKDYPVDVENEGDEGRPNLKAAILRVKNKNNNFENTEIMEQSGVFYNGSRRINRNECHLFASSPSIVSMGQCSDMYDEGECVVSLKVPQFPRTDVEGTQKDTKKSSRKEIKNKSQKGALDQDGLCADIANYDTVFMGIGVKETPEFLAARSIKGKIKNKKKKSINDEKLSNSLFISSANDDSETFIGPNDLAESFQSPVKVKKKIKIVIGKKPSKHKMHRKKSLSEG